MLRSSCGHALLDQLALGVYLGMCLVAIELLTALLRPLRVRVLVALLVGLVFFVILRVPLFRIPELVSFSLFDELVLLTAVALARHLHKTAVDDNPLIHNQMVVPEVLVELVEQCVKKALSPSALF